MIPGKFSIHCEDNPAFANKRFYFVAENERGERFIAKPMQLEFEKLPEGTRVHPTLEFDGNIAREFFPAFHAAMIESGYLKPIKDESVEAIKFHLEDMRKIAFGSLGFKEKQS